MKPGFDFQPRPEWPEGFQYWHHGPFSVFEAPGWIAWLMLGVGALLYLVPTFVAYRRRHHNRAAIALLNVLLGWTFFGWAAALVWAATAVRSPWHSGSTGAARPPPVPEPPPRESPPPGLSPPSDPPPG